MPIRFLQNFQGWKFTEDVRYTHLQAPSCWSTISTAHFRLVYSRFLNLFWASGYSSKTHDLLASDSLQQGNYEFNF